MRGRGRSGAQPPVATQHKGPSIQGQTEPSIHPGPKTNGSARASSWKTHIKKKERKSSGSEIQSDPPKKWPSRRTSPARCIQPESNANGAKSQRETVPTRCIGPSSVMKSEQDRLNRASPPGPASGRKEWRPVSNCHQTKGRPR